jgi:hypothetical protein
LPLEDDQIDSFRRRLEAEVDKRAEDIRDLKKQRNKEETAKGDEIQQFKSKEAGAHERRRGVTSQLVSAYFCFHCWSHKPDRTPSARKSPL